MTAQPQLELVAAVAGWRDPSPRGERNREAARRHAVNRSIEHLKMEQAELRRQVAELTTIRDTIVDELANLAREKPMAIHEIADELDRIIGTDHPNNIMHRLGYKSIDRLKRRLCEYGRPDLAQKLNKPVLNRPRGGETGI